MKSDPPVTSPRLVTDLVAGARRGLRRDVRALLDGLQHAELCIPLRQPMVGVPLGERLEMPEELSLVPHVLEDEEGDRFAALFTDPEMLERAQEELGWLTGEGALEYCALPALTALDLALQVVDDEHVIGLVLNPLHDSELLLSRQELASLAQNTALPLVSYVRDIPELADEHTLVGELDGPPPRELTAALDALVAEGGALSSYRLAQTFNAERDLEPHLTLHVVTRGDVEIQALSRMIVERIEGKVPEPGYIDILFDQVAIDAPMGGQVS
ncbi:MAG: SseB family protein [Polyangiaceae bacterium]|nr:SseB family protein [Polyangiaceae bacterium]